MKRREFVSLLGGVATASILSPPPVSAQQPVLPIVGFLGFTAPAPELVAPFIDGLAKAGFVDGRNARVEYRWAHNQADRLPALVADLLGQQVALIVTVGGTSTARAAMAAKPAVPVVFEVGRDPVETGLVTSLNRPGGNATGAYMLTSALNGKRLELLHEMAPRAGTVAVLMPHSIGALAQTIESEVRAAAAAVGVQAHVVYAGTEREIEAAFTVLIEKRIGALIVVSSPFFNSRREQLVALTTRHKLPTIFEWREFTAIGGLMSYGTDYSGVLREIGVYAGRILKGAKPADLPVLQPTRFELVINRKTAKALGLAIPQSLFQRADEVIE